MYRVEYTQEAEDTISEIYSFIAHDSVFQAVKVISHIKNTIDVLKLFPLAGSMIAKNMRMIVDTKYKYRIVYLFSSNTIIILSITKYKNLN